MKERDKKKKIYQDFQLSIRNVNQLFIFTLLENPQKRIKGKTHKATEETRNVKNILEEGKQTDKWSLTQQSRKS